MLGRVQGCYLLFAIVDAASQLVAHPCITGTIARRSRTRNDLFWPSEKDFWRGIVHVHDMSVGEEGDGGLFS